MKIFRLLARRSLRIGAIVLLAGAIFAFGHYMTPRQPTAMARVYEDLGSALNQPGVPEYMKGVVDEGKVQEVYVNGNTLFYTLYKTDKSIDQLLDYYENLYKGPHHELATKEAKEALLKYAAPEDRAEHARRIEETEKVLNQRYIRFSGDGWGGFSTIVTGKEGTAEWSQDLVQRFTTFKETGLASDLGDPKIVVAFDEPSTGATQYFNVWPGADFDHRNIAPRNGEDATGYDLDDIPRPPRSQRMLTFGQTQANVRYEILTYKSEGYPEPVMRHWYEAMDRQGWALSPTFEEGKTRADEPIPAALFAKDGREAYVALAVDEDDRTVTSTVVVHKRGG
jgi:hypothetical protein